MVSIIDEVMTYECSGLSAVINLAKEQLAKTRSDKLPIFPWDL